MKKLILAAVTLFITTVSLSQNENNWELYNQTQGVQIYSQEVNCFAKNIPDQIAVLLKVVNTTGHRIRIEWDIAIWYNDIEVVNNISDGENHYSIELDANGLIIGDCEIPYGALYIYKDFITYKTDTKLSKFELQNITVTQLDK